MTESSPRRRALVLGAGIQGCCAALALHRAGWAVTVIEATDRPFRGTSLRGEGKLHLGYVYAHDATGATSRLMAEGAMSFSPLVDSWLPAPVAWEGIRSAPFVYGILDSSMVPADVLGERYATTDADLATHLAAGASYAGSSTLEPARRVARPSALGFGPSVTAAFVTGEVALDPRHLRGLLTEGVAAAGIPMIGRTVVQAVERRPAGMAVVAERRDPDGVTVVEHRGDVVVNCLWHGRLAVDATMGIEPSRPWSYRLKYGIVGRLADSLTSVPSATFALGPFGDVVQYQDGTVYLSWYPECMAAWCANRTVPDAWLEAMSTEHPAPAGLVERSVTALADLVPALAGFVPGTASPGIVVAWGDTDIDDPASALHRRDAIGVHDHGDYLSIDTGKLTTAPLFADRLARMLDR